VTLLTGLKHHRFKHPDSTKPGEDQSLQESQGEPARRHIATVATLDEVFALLRRHDEGDTGICNHSAHETVYSYVLRRRDRQTTLCVIQGKPCEASPYQELELPLGSLWSADAAAAFQSAYPSRVELAG
jgi:hypothetical protein